MAVCRVEDVVAVGLLNEAKCPSRIVAPPLALATQRCGVASIKPRAFLPISTVRCVSLFPSPDVFEVPLWSAQLGR